MGGVSKGDRARILVVDDSPANLVTIEAALEPVNADIVWADSGIQALRQLLGSDFAAVLLDVRMPGMDGFETAALIRARKRSQHTPIIFMTGFREEDLLRRAYGLGAVDFLFKPLVPEVLRSKITVFVELFQKARVLELLTEQVRRLNVNLEAEVEKRTLELQSARIAAEAANREKSRFLASMSHELRTPLNAVIGYAEMLEEEAAGRGVHDFVPDLQKIRRAAGHLLGLINNVLDMARIEAGKMSPALERFEVRAMTEEAISTAEPLIRKNGNRLECQMPAEPFFMVSDPTRIRQCLLNLLSNAAKFTRDGRIGLDVRREGEQVLFTVSDSGTGIPAEQFRNLFQPFTQFHSNPEAGGSGLGLAITHRLCGLLGGEITVESEIGVGSRFSIALPLTAPALDRETEATRERQTAGAASDCGGVWA